MEEEDAKRRAEFMEELKEVKIEDYSEAERTKAKQSTTSKRSASHLGK